MAAILLAREEEEEKRERAELHRLAPGYNPNSVLAPTHGNEAPAQSHEEVKSDKPQPTAAEQAESDSMDALVAQLEKMENSK